MEAVAACVFQELTDTSNQNAALLLLLQREDKVRITGYVETIIPLYSNLDFRLHFRLNRQTVQIALEQISATEAVRLHKTDGPGRPAVPLPKQFLAFLWYSGNLETYRSVADRFDLTKSCLHDVVRRLSKALAEISGNVISWPSGPEIARVQASFQERNGFPKVLGCVDGSHITIKAPTSFPEQYVNRKGFYSVVLQAVCDDQKKFTHAFCGYPGSVHDARIWRNSSVFLNRADLFPNGTHLLGDSAYPLDEMIMVPFKDNGTLGRRQRMYNYKHSSTRMVIENSFALLKGRWRRLKMVDMNIGNIPGFVLACAVLHNICLLNDDELLDNLETDDDDEPDIAETWQEETVSGSQKRLLIMNEIT